MLMAVGLALWAGIGAGLGLVVNSQAFTQGWSEAAPEVEGELGSPTPEIEKRAVGDRNDRRLLVAGVVAAVVSGAVSMTLIVGETVVGLLVSLLVALVSATAVLLTMTATQLAAESAPGHDDDQRTPFDQ